MATQQGIEEAANIAAEFISSLDNLPGEVSFLLNEIRVKDLRCQELQAEITKDQSKFLKHSLRHPTPPSTNASTPNAQGNTPNQTPQTPSSIPQKYAHVPQKVSDAYKEINTLSDAKVVLAERLVALVNRVKARLDIDLARAGVVGGEFGAGALSGVSLSSAGLENAFVVPGRNPISQVNEGLRQALPAEPSPQPPTKKRRMASQASTIKLHSPSPAPPPTTQHQRSRLSRQVHPEEEDMDADADADADMEPAGGDEEVEDEADDNTPYCTCQSPSYGDMIGCDNPGCPYEWFHLICVDMEQPLPDKWYCDECRVKMASSGRKKKK